VAGRIHRNGECEANLSVDGRAAIAAESGRAGTRDSRDDTGGGVDAADAVALELHDEEIARGIYCPSSWIVQRGLNGRSAIACGCRGTGAGYQPEGACGPIDPHHAVVLGVGNIDITRRIYRNACRPGQLRVD